MVETLGVKLFYNGCSSNNIFDIIYNYNSDIKYWNFFRLKEHSCNYFSIISVLITMESSVWINCNRKIRHDIK